MVPNPTSIIIVLAPEGHTVVIEKRRLVAYSQLLFVLANSGLSNLGATRFGQCKSTPSPVNSAYSQDGALALYNGLDESQ